MAAIAFEKEGNGFPLVLIHGFPMHRHVWDDFKSEFSNSFTVYTIDLPGFGESALLKENFTIDEIATVVLDWARQQKLERFFIIGHSLGGYVALGMANQAPDPIAGMVLLHSTALADNPEKKQSRDKVLDFVDKNGAEAFTSNFIAPLFANQNHPAVDEVKVIASKASAEAVKGYTRAMRDRSDRTAVIKNLKFPLLLVGGEKDGGISPASLQEQANLNPKAEVTIYSDVAHMGMFEAPKMISEKFRSFFRKIPVT